MQHRAGESKETVFSPDLQVKPADARRPSFAPLPIGSEDVRSKIRWIDRWVSEYQWASSRQETQPMSRLQMADRDSSTRGEVSPVMGRLNGKVAVVTGASSGIGEATVRALSGEGAAVVAGARRRERLEKLVEEVTRDGGKAIAVECDVTDEEQAHALVDRAIEEFGRIDVLVNNAGVMLLSKVEKGLSEEWRRMFDVNVLGLLYATDAAIEAMKRQGGGHIVNVSSVAGRKTRPTVGVYSGTKFAVNAVSEALRQEVLEDGIRVTVVEPGAVATELTDHITDEEVRAGLKQRSIEPLQPEDIANAVAYAVGQPQRVSVNEILIRPTQQTN